MNQTDIKKAKYNLIREIKNHYDIDEFFKPKLDNYKVLASIYKVFKSKINSQSVNPHDIVTSKYTIIENIMNVNTTKEDEKSELMKQYEEQSKDLQLLSYKIMIDRFNDKYKHLNSDQKSLIKEYINNISHANSLRDYILKQLPIIENEIAELQKIIVDKSVNIKLNEVTNQVNMLKNINVLNDDHMVAMLNVYELLKELKKIPLEK